MKLPRRCFTSRPANDIAPLIRLWLLRLMVPLGGMNNLVQECHFNEADVAQAIGLGDWIDSERKPFNRAAIRTTLRKLHSDAERLAHLAEASSCLRSNTERLARLVGLSSLDRRILEFAALLHTETLLDNAADLLGSLSSSKVIQVVSTVLGLPEREVRLALSPQGVLTRSGLVSLNRDGSSFLRTKLELLSAPFADHIVSSETDPVNLIRDTVRLANEPKLDFADYPHIAASLTLLHAYFQHSLEVRRPGVNVFVYGTPGTGKSELARALAKEMQCPLFEVASENGDGNPVPGEIRLRAFRAAQSFFAQRRAMLLFDEAEDVFSDGDAAFGFKSTAQRRKAWINRMLEENPVPTLWLSNRVDSLDPAFIRRFDMVIELPVPPKGQRERIVRVACPDLLDDQTISRIAESPSLAPALVTRAASIVAALRPALTNTQASAAIEHLISNTLAAQGHRPLRRYESTQLPESYDPSFIQADADLMAIAREMVRVRTGRLCLYGPPGTGKTAYGCWLAEQMDVSLHTKRASDLLGMHVGESEKRIADAFRDAEKDNAILLIDEVDSFLQDRRDAQRTWEVSLVNEMLTQMESFSGVFIASTNLMDDLDPAALRRFDLKVKLGFLRPAQSWALLERTCACLALPPPAAQLQSTLSRLDRLTPGDFAAVVRQHRFRPVASPSLLVSALAAEVALKEGSKATIGFV